MEARDIIQAPIITEKSMSLKENFNKYTFKVAKGANKVQIKKAVEEIFNVKVLSVATINVLPKRKRVGQHVGYTAAYKKAIVTLTEKSKEIEFFQGL